MANLCSGLRTLVLRIWQYGQGAISWSRDPGLELKDLGQPVILDQRRLEIPTFVEFATTVETKHGHVIDQLNLDMVIGFRLGEEDYHNQADVYLVDGDSFRAWKEQTDPFRRLAEKQHP